MSASSEGASGTTQNPDSLAKANRKKTLWISVTGVAVILLFVMMLSYPNKGQSANIDKQTVSAPVAQPETYTREYVVTSDMPDGLRIEIPLGWEMKARWGNAPLDTRSNSHLGWYVFGHMPQHIDLGTMLEWQEFRLNRDHVTGNGFKGFEGKATIYCTFVQKWSRAKPF